MQPTATAYIRPPPAASGTHIRRYCIDIFLLCEYDGRGKGHAAHIINTAGRLPASRLNSTREMLGIAHLYERACLRGVREASISAFDDWPYSIAFPN